MGGEAPHPGPLPIGEGTGERYPQVRSSSSIRTLSGACTKAILTPGRMVRGGTVKTAPRWVSSAYAALTQRGAVFTVPPRTIRPGVRIAFVQAPDNVRIELLER